MRAMSKATSPLPQPISRQAIPSLIPARTRQAVSRVLHHTRENTQPLSSLNAPANNVVT